MRSPSASATARPPSTRFAASPWILDDHEPAELPVWVKAIAKLAAASYQEPSARDARRRILAFFDGYLKS
jgi:hypothetical protein